MRKQINFQKNADGLPLMIAKEAGISPVLLNSYMSERIAKKSRVENMRLKIFVRLWPIVLKWKQEQEGENVFKN